MTTAKDYLHNIKYPRTHWRTRRAIRADIDKLLADIHKHVNKGLHIGSGSTKLPGLINCDLFDPDADMKADAASLDMFNNGTIDLIESHHMIEHMSFADAEKALKEWRRVLCDGGLLIMTYPDITRVCLKWLKHSLLHFVSPRTEKLDYILKMMVGSQEHDGMFHQSAYDAKSMHRLLAKCDFEVEFTYVPYPRRPTPSLLTIARKKH